MDAYLQDQRLLQIDTVLDKDHILLVSIEGTDRISALFTYELELTSTDPDLKPDDLLGTAARIHVHPGGAETDVSVDGIISRFGVVGRTNHGLHLYRARLVPTLWLLTRTSDCRIFQDQNVRDIVDSVLAEYGVQRREWRLGGDHAKREYCVQYRETAYDFVCRLLEEEAISFYFRQDDSGHTLVLCDNNHGFGKCVAPTVRLVPEDRLHNGVWEWEHGYRFRSGQWALADFNFQMPSTHLTTQRKTVNPVLAKRPLEMYDYPGRYGKKDAGDTLTQWRIEYEEAAYHEISGAGGCHGFSAGACFALSNATSRDAGQEFLLTEVNHTAEDWSLLTHDGQASYSNRFRCVQRAVPYRPPMQTPSPRIHGTQTAIVTGPGGSEICTDSFGRIKVQFHWDRYGKNNDHSSCWIRVAQTSAGRGWGGWYLPRIGQEVVVTFLEGDPDQPLVVGSVYNAEQTVPFALPGNATQSGVRTRSSMGGSAANCNEMRFEDKKGAEQFYLHAERNLDSSVELDETHSVGHDQSITIGHDRTEKVGNDETITIGDNRTEAVVNNESVTIGMARTHTIGAVDTLTVGVSRVHTVGATETINVGATQSITVGKSQSTDVGSDRSVSVGADQSISVSGSETYAVSKDRATTISGSNSLQVGKSLTINAGDEIVLQTGSATITMKKNGDITIEGKQITIKGSGDVVIKGQKILQN